MGIRSDAIGAWPWGTSSSRPATPRAYRRQRARVYELVLREGGPDDVLTYVDGALLVDLWDDLVLPASVRAA